MAEYPHPYALDATLRDARDAMIAAIAATSDEAVLGVLAELTGNAEANTDFQPPRVLQYARDAGDRMRVVVDVIASQVAVNLGYVSQQFGAQGVYPLWYAANGAVTSMDPREQTRLSSETNMRDEINRWVFT